VAAYGRARPLLRGQSLAVAREFHSQELEYVDALTKAIRGVGGEVDAEAEEADEAAKPVESSRRGFLELLYGLEGSALSEDLVAAARLNASAPRSLAASLAAGHAQQLTVLRQLLGASLTAAVPAAFDGGDVPPPGGAAAGGGG
jgi:Ferritin-like domain